MPPPASAGFPIEIVLLVIVVVACVAAVVLKVIGV